MQKMQKPKEWNYVMVFTDKGPRFVTSCNFLPKKVCIWEDNKPPLEFEHDDATYVAFALSVNGNFAVCVSSRFQITEQLGG